jgi:hypothetical protein
MHLKNPKRLLIWNGGSSILSILFYLESSASEWCAILYIVQVRYLKIIEKSGYQALPWVRYITMAGEYELRLI